MVDVPVTIVLPSGGARRADIPDDVPVGEIIEELTSLLKLPTVGPDGRPMGYRLDSKALGKELTEKETLASAHVPSEDRLMISADITAGSWCIDRCQPAYSPVKNGLSTHPGTDSQKRSDSSRTVIGAPWPSTGTLHRYF